MLYQLNTLMRFVGFVSRMLVGIVIGFILGVMWTEGKMHIPIAQAATIDPYLRSPDGTPITEGIVEFDFSATDFAEGTNYYKFSVNTDHSPYQYATACASTAGGIITSSLSIPASPGVYSGEKITEYTDSSCIIPNGTTNYDDTFTVNSAEEATTTATTTDGMTRKDSMFIYGVIIFLLAYPVWVRVFSL